MARSPRPSSPRRAFNIPEILVSLMLLGVALSVIVPLARRANEQGRRSETRRAALLEVSNALERLTANPTSGPTPGSEQTLPLSESLSRRLTEPQLVVRTVALEDPVGRRFDAALTWREPTGGRSAPLRLSAFAFDRPVAAGEAP